MRSQEKNRKRSADADRSEVARRLFLAMVLGLCLAACDPEGMKTGLPPWHMWGNSEQVGPITASGVGTGVGIQTNQLVRIQYARPDTWRWLWEVTVNQAHITAETGAQLVLVLRVSTGLGRSKMTIPLGRFVFVVPNGATLVAPIQKFSNNTNGPLTDDSQAPVPAPPLPNVLDSFVGQDIQVEVLSQFFSTEGDTVSFETTALFAPNAHIRPEWTSGLYPGAEDGGMTERLDR